MSEMRKYKGRVKVRTLNKILIEDAEKSVYATGGMLYRTKKNTFFAKPHGTQYFDIFIIFGSGVLL